MPKLVISEARKADFVVCPHTKRYINTKPNPKPLRKGLEPGRVVIILSGKYAGMRAIYLKQLENNHLLLNGPFGINQVPLCAVPQRNVIITSSKVENCNVDVKDFTFTLLCRPLGLNKAQIEEFDKQQPAYLAEWQKKVDEQLVKLVPKEYVDYLKTPFVVRRQDKVHEFKF